MCEIKKSWPEGTLLKGTSAVPTYVHNQGLNQEPRASRGDSFRSILHLRWVRQQAYLTEAAHKPKATTFYLHLCRPSVSASSDQSLLDKKAKSKRSRGENRYGVAVARKEGEEEIMLQGWRRLGRVQRRGKGRQKEMMLVMRGGGGSGGKRKRRNEGRMWKNSTCTWIKRGWRWLHNYLNS